MHLLFTRIPLPSTTITFYPVVYKFNSLDIFFAGDSLTIIDGVTQQETSLCSSTLDDDWLSSGNVAILKFTAGVKGHGLSYSYEAFPGNETISGDYSFRSGHVCFVYIYMQ